MLSGFKPASFIPDMQHFPIFPLSEADMPDIILLIFESSIFILPIFIPADFIPDTFIPAGFIPDMQHFPIFFFSAEVISDIIVPIFMLPKQHIAIFSGVAFAEGDLAGIFAPPGISSI